MNNNNENIIRLISAVETSGADIAPTYAEYIQLAFALATDMGEAGRDAFHRLCRPSAKYDHAHADTVYTGALKNTRGDVHLGTVFHLAEMAGVKVGHDSGKRAEMNGGNDMAKVGTVGHLGTASQSHMRARIYNVENDSDSDGLDDDVTINGSEPYVRLPVFKQSGNMPDLINRIISFGETNEQRDVLLIGGLTALGAALGDSVRCLYGRKWQSPCLQTFVVAPPASGKGVLSWVRLLVEPIHDEIRQQVAEKMKQYKQEKAAYDVSGKERQKTAPPERPRNKMFIISGNNTGTGILQNIMDSDGQGIICENEADTITTAIGSDYGHWSDTLRKAFDHDRLSYNRRTDQEFREVRKSYLGVMLSGTPAQVKPLIPSAENGLFSRQLFYYMPAIREWQDQFCEDDIDAEAEFRALGKEWKELLGDIRRRGLQTLRLSIEQKHEFNKVFRTLFKRSGISNGYEMSSSVARLAINTCRMMMVVAVLRSLEDQSLSTPDADTNADNLKDGIISRWDLTITQDDFHTVLEMVEPLYQHATHVLSFLNVTEITSRGMADKDKLIADMGNVFTRKQLLERASEIGIPTYTAVTWLKRLAKRGSVASVDGKGTYRKL